MPLASVTSVNRSARVPSARISRSLREQPVPERRSAPAAPPERRRRCRASASASECRAAALHEQDVEVAVVVEVEESRAAAADLGLVEAAGHPGRVHEVESAGRGAVDEPLPGGAGRRLRATAAEGRGGSRSRRRAPAPSPPPSSPRATAPAQSPAPTRSRTRLPRGAYPSSVRRSCATGDTLSEKLDSWRGASLSRTVAQASRIRWTRPTGARMLRRSARTTRRQAPAVARL